jgi:hypothetical protein
VRSWWEERDPDPPEHGEHVNKRGEQDQKADTYADSGVHATDEHDVNTHQGEVNTPAPSDADGEQDEHVHGLFTEEMNAENSLSKHNGAHKRGAVHLFSEFTDVENLSFLDDEEEL